MSDFLSRVAARAVGEAPVASPRPASRFEDAGAAADAALEVVGVEVAAAAAPRPPDTPLPVAVPGTPDALPEAGPVSGRTVPGQPERAAHSTRLPGEPDGPAAPIVSRKRDDRGLEVASAVPHERDPLPAAPAPVVVAPAAAHPLPAPAAVAVAVPAAPVVPEAARAADVRLAAVSAADVEEPAVRVHIGRLEVRANLQQAPPQRPPRDDARPQELSLADYLRGRRETA